MNNDDMRVSVVVSKSSVYNKDHLSYRTGPSEPNHLCICCWIQPCFLWSQAFWPRTRDGKNIQVSADNWMHATHTNHFLKSLKIELEPTMLISVTSLHHVPHIKVLSVAIDKYQNWASHLKHFYLKLVKHHHNTSKLRENLGGLIVTCLKYDTIHLQKRLFFMGLEFGKSN